MPPIPSSSLPVLVAGGCIGAAAYATLLRPAQGACMAMEDA